MNDTRKISIVVPVYHGEGTVEELAERVIKVVRELECVPEVILVNDASPDCSWECIKRLKQAHSEVIGVNFSRNFGQHYAISAGLAETSGDWVVVMDCDLQDVPEEISKLFQKAQQGYDIVLAKRAQRKDSFFKRLFSKMFYRFLSYLSGVKYDPQVANFGIYNRSVINTINSLPEKNRFFPSMIKWVGYNQTGIEVNHAERAEGKSSYNFKRLLNLSLDIILSYSDKPLRLTIKLGLLITFFALVFSAIQAYMWYIGEIQVIGYTSLILSIWLLCGIIIFVLGVVGLYIGKIFENVKDRPTYIIKEKI